MNEEIIELEKYQISCSLLMPDTNRHLPKDVENEAKCLLLQYYREEQYKILEDFDGEIDILFPEISYTIRPHWSDDGKIDGKTIGFFATPYYLDDHEELR